MIGYHKQFGFTLVELLIVIVVIAILAAIAIVSYNGIQERAYNSATISAANNAVKTLRLAYAGQGQIQLENGVPNGGIAFCIGAPSDFPATDNMDEGECATNAGYVSQELWGVLKNYGTSNYELREWYDGSYNYIRGIMYLPNFYSGDTSAYGFLVYSLVGADKDCVVSGAKDINDINLSSGSNGSNETSCWIDMHKMLGENPITW